jgi:hypothetical protein
MSEQLDLALNAETIKNIKIDTRFSDNSPCEVKHIYISQNEKDNNKIGIWDKYLEYTDD